VQPRPAKLRPLDPRVPAWPTDQLEERECPLCDAEGEARFIRPDGLQVLHCHICGVYYISPAPTKEALAEFYRSYYRTHQRCVPTPRDAHHILRVTPTSDFRVRKVLDYVDVKGRPVLDVGFGWGDFLVRFRALGAVAEGIDLDPDAVEFVRRYLGIPGVWACDLADFRPNRQYAVVVMNDLIEHPLRPRDLLESARRLLDEDGLIAITTPNASFAERQPEPIVFRVDLEHMQYLTFESCAFLARELGLEIIHCESFGHAATCKTDPNGPSRPRPAVQILKRCLWNVPGFDVLNKVRRGIKERAWQRTNDLRRGDYQLFVLMRKPPRSACRVPVCECPPNTRTTTGAGSACKG